MRAMPRYDHSWCSRCGYWSEMTCQSRERRPRFTWGESDVYVRCRECKTYWIVPDCFDLHTLQIEEMKGEEKETDAESGDEEDEEVQVLGPRQNASDDEDENDGEDKNEKDEGAVDNNMSLLHITRENDDVNDILGESFEASSIGDVDASFSAVNGNENMIDENERASDDPENAQEGGSQHDE